MGKKSRRQRSTQTQLARRYSRDPHALAKDLLDCVWTLRDEDPWSERRLFLFDSYIAAILPLDLYKDSESREMDVRVLKMFQRSRNEPVFYRAQACLAIGICQRTFGDIFANTLKWFDRAFHLYNSADDLERNRVACLKDVEVRMGDLYDRRRGEVFDWIRKLDGKFCIGRWIPDYSGSEVAYTDGLVSKVAGWECDCCRKHRDEVDGGVLFHCTKCAMTFYCSRECQEKVR